MDRKLYNIQFHGSLAEQFGDDIQLCHALHLQDAVEALVAKFGDIFRTTILNGAWHIVVGNPEKENPVCLSEKHVNFSLQDTELHFIPAIYGAGGKSGFGEIILGVVLIAAAVVTGGSAIGLGGLEMAASVGGAAEVASVIGVGIAGSSIASGLAIAGVMSMLGGILSLIVPVPKMNYGVAQRQSFIFNGVVNNTQQGTCVPLIYGRHLTGSTVISADIQTGNVNWNMLTAQQVAEGVLH